MTTERRFMWVKDHNKYLEIVAPDNSEAGVYPRYLCATENGDTVSLAVIEPDWVLVSYNEAIAARLRGAGVVFRTTE